MARPVHKVKHPKGYGTDKEHRVKKVWYEVRCELHGTIHKGGTQKMLKVVAPASRFERKVQGCPICARITRRAGDEVSHL